MPIVSNSFTTTLQADSSNNVTAILVDNSGKTYSKQWNAAPGVDVQSVIDNYSAALSEQLAQQEFEALIGG